MTNQQIDDIYLNTLRIMKKTFYDFVKNEFNFIEIDLIR